MRRTRFERREAILRAKIIVSYPPLVFKQNNLTKSKICSLMGLFCLAVIFSFTASGSISILPPLQSKNITQRNNQASTIPTISAELSRFTASLPGEGFQPAGLYVEDLFALRIVQQPADNPVFVSDQLGVVTLFLAANQFHSLGLLAHSSLAGGNFFALQKGQIIILINGQGMLSYYRVDDLQRYQALSPSSPNSDFFDPSTNLRLSAGDLFQKIYGTSDRLILQTCISSPDSPSWGRYFVIALPINQAGP
jgi:hypothetical protein